MVYIGDYFGFVFGMPPHSKVDIVLLLLFVLERITEGKLISTFVELFHQGFEEHNFFQFANRKYKK